MKTGGKTTKEWNSRIFFLSKKCHHFSKSLLNFIKDNDKSKYSENKKRANKSIISKIYKIIWSIFQLRVRIKKKDTEMFCNIEKELYEVYPEFKELETFFIVGDNKIKRLKTLKENNISNGDLL